MSQLRVIPASTDPASYPTWSYSGDPSASPKDEVRFLIGDTDPQNPLFGDAELTYLLGQSDGAVLPAAIEACQAAIASLARLCDETVGHVSLKLSQRGAGFETLLLQLRRRTAMLGIPYAGGISVTDKLSQRAAGDRVKPSFIRDLLQNPDDPESDAGVDVSGTGGELGGVADGVADTATIDGPGA